MKPFIILICIVFTQHYLFGQKEVEHAPGIQSLYLAIDLPYSFNQETFPIQGGLDLDLRAGYGFQFIFTYHSIEARNKPSDYNGQSDFWPPYNPETIESWSLLVHKSKTTDGILRLKYGIGPSFIMYQEPVFTRIFNPSRPFEVKYDVSFATSHYVGIYGQVKAELLATRFAGLELGLTFKINKPLSYFSIDAGILLGYLRPKLAKPRRAVEI